MHSLELFTANTWSLWGFDHPCRGGTVHLNQFWQKGRLSKKKLNICQKCFDLFSFENFAANTRSLSLRILSSLKRRHTSYELTRLKDHPVEVKACPIVDCVKKLKYYRKWFGTALFGDFFSQNQIALNKSTFIWIDSKKSVGQ